MQKNWEGNYDADFSELLGKTLTAIHGGVSDETIVFDTREGPKYQQHYYEDCCARCSVEEIHGDLSDLIGSPILMAEEVQSSEPDPEIKAKRDKARAEAKAKSEYYYDDNESETWTFYKLATIKGSVTIRWYGSSNGYYSETPTFERLG